MAGWIDRKIETQDNNRKNLKKVDSPILHYGSDTTPEDQLPIKLTPILFGKRVVRTPNGDTTKPNYIDPTRTPGGVVFMDSVPTLEQIMEIIPEALLDRLARG